jgi:excisionase family DNA binding protein
VTYYLQNCTVVDAAGVPVDRYTLVSVYLAQRLLGVELPSAGSDYASVDYVNQAALTLSQIDTPISVTHAALRLGVSTTRVRKLLATGKLLGYKHGRDWQVNAASVDDYRTSQLCRLRTNNQADRLDKEPTL